MGIGDDMSDAEERLLCIECMNKNSCSDYEDSKDSLLKYCSGFIREPERVEVYRGIRIY